MSSQFYIKENNNHVTNVTIVPDYGGKGLKQDLEFNPIKIIDCNIEQANLGNVDQQICMAS